MLAVPAIFPVEYTEGRHGCACRGGGPTRTPQQPGPAPHLRVTGRIRLSPGPRGPGTRGQRAVGTTQPRTLLQPHAECGSFGLERDVLARLQTNLQFLRAPLKQELFPKTVTELPRCALARGPVSEPGLGCWNRFGKTKESWGSFPYGGQGRLPGPCTPTPGCSLATTPEKGSGATSSHCPGEGGREKGQLGNKLNSLTLPPFLDPRHTPKVFHGFLLLFF
ncbi:uncharacterized protein LOC115899637 [Rhinopithecus roxellana]|uniref:uncharacterized protein LOC115899637 n=1 Tax=Rhinopithecus roxellana TaxID=61622 RepID=UPI00123773A1|nr:uncharacterized protein LOC115899637 [Rhinopithecus roxellana]